MSSRPANNFTRVTYKGALNIATLSTLSYSSNYYEPRASRQAHPNRWTRSCKASPQTYQQHRQNGVLGPALEVAGETPTLGVTTIRPRNLWLWLPLDLFFRTKKTRIDMDGSPYKTYGSQTGEDMHNISYIFSMTQRLTELNPLFVRNWKHKTHWDCFREYLQHVTEKNKVLKGKKTWNQQKKHGKFQPPGTICVG